MFPRILVYSLLCAIAYAVDSVPEFDIDPYLEYRPAFAQSLPVQILLTGVVLTLVSVLFIHLIFTAQYHWPLAPVNYVLQLSGVTTLLISLIATLQVVLSATLAESEKWPYMLSYIAVNVPPMDQMDLDTDDWSTAERATWLVMNASTSGLIQITHIQFLTLLYPSRLEGRLIFTLLGPLAIVAAVMQILQMHDNSDVVYVASAVRNVCNATLSLLFTAALFIWGLLVNRRQAWRTDGGTAVFGAAALTLAVVSTALNFLYVPREEEYVWLPSLMWAVILWQSFLGWWWWVGAGSGSGLSGNDNIVEKLEKEARRESRRQEARERRRETKMKARKVWRDVAGAFAPHASSNRERPTNPENHSDPQRDLSVSSPPLSPSDSPPTSPAIGASRAPSVVSTSSAGTFATLPRLLPTIIHRWYASLRHAHLIAARQQAVERVERIRELERNGGSAGPATSGWGLGSFWWRTGREPIRRSPSHELEASSQSGWSTRHQASLESKPQTQNEQAAGDREASHHSTRSPPRPVAPRPRSVWWWGPLARWRLQDSTSY